MYPKNIKDVDQGVRARVAVERRIVQRLIKDLLAARFTLAVFDGEETHPRTQDEAELYKNIMETDEDYLFVYTNMTSERFGWVRLTYGNDGYDVISDYTVNLEDALKGVNEFASSLE